MADVETSISDYVDFVNIYDEEGELIGDHLDDDVAIRISSAI